MNNNFVSKLAQMGFYQCILFTFHLFTSIVTVLSTDDEIVNNLQ